MSMIYREDHLDSEARSFESWIIIESKVRIFVWKFSKDFEYSNIPVFKPHSDLPGTLKF